MANLHRHTIASTDIPDASEAASPARVYMDFFGFTCPPFAITPDPEFLFLSETHRSSIEKVRYGIDSRQGFMLLTGEVGTGKSTLCRVILDLLQEAAQTVYVINPSLDAEELLATILDDLGAPRAERPSKKALIDQLNTYLLSRSCTRPVLIIIDDAQTMPHETLEDMRLLSNLETDKNKLLQVLLVGQPELRDQLEQSPMRQLRQRIAVSCHLDFLKADEVGRYIERRLFVAGNHGQVRFTPRLVKQIHKASGGVPRLINKICDLALTAAYTADSPVVGRRHLRAAKEEIVELAAYRGPGRTACRRRAATVKASAVVAAGLAAAVLVGAGAFPFLKGPLGWEGQADASQRVTGAVVKALSPDGEPGDPSPASATATPFAPDPAAVGAGAFILQLGAYKTLETTLRAVDIFAHKRIEAHWAVVPSDQGREWYRVFAGRFATRQDAQAYRRAHGLTDAIVHFAPWTVAVGGAGSTEQIAALRQLLTVYHLDGYAASGAGGRVHLLSGAFLSRGGAEAMAHRIRQHTGLVVQVADLSMSAATGLDHPSPGGENRSS